MKLAAAHRHLEEEREELERAGGVFVPTEKERRDDEINGKLPKLTSLKLGFYRFLSYDETYHIGRWEDYTCDPCVEDGTQW